MQICVPSMLRGLISSQKHTTNTLDKRGATSDWMICCILGDRFK
jgi:hypothetical protein